MQSLRLTIITAAVALISIGQPISFGFLKSLPNAFSVYAAVKDNSEIATIGKVITVRIEGATKGSGVLVDKAGDSYSVLTAWHVIKDNRPNEEVGIITADGKEHLWEPDSIRQLGNVDLGIITFRSKKLYEIGRIGDAQNLSMGNKIFVTGFPLITSSVPNRILRFLDGTVVANANIKNPGGYQLLYSNKTLPGMSGGAVLNSKGDLVGIHGRAESLFNKGEILRTGTNQGIPITYYRQIELKEELKKFSEKSSTPDDFLLEAFNILSKGPGYHEKDKEPFKRILLLSNKVLKIKPTNSLAYAYRASAYVGLGKYEKAINDANKSITIDPFSAYGYLVRGDAKSNLLRMEEAIEDFKKSLEIDPNNHLTHNNLGVAYHNLGQLKEALNSYNNSINLNPNSPSPRSNRGWILIELGEKSLGCNEIKTGALMGDQVAEEWLSMKGNENCINL